MPTEVAVRYPVYRHGSDDVAHDCGRACAQMVIASIVLGASGASANTRVPETQQSLKNREPYVAGPGGWDTFPTELVDVLKNSVGLSTLMLNRWRVAHHMPAAGSSTGNDQALQDLLTNIVDGLRRGSPSILNIKSVDHWVVVSRAWVNDDGSVETLESVDPAGLDTHVDEGAHRYRDACHNEGTDYWSVRTPVELAGFQLAVGTVPPTDYAGEYVAIVPEITVRRPGWIKDTIWWFSSIQKWLIRFWRSPKFLALVPGPGPVPDIVTGLRQVAVSLGLVELKALLDANPEVLTRTVRDLAGSADRYLLGSLFDRDSGRGLIGVFNVTTNRVSRFRLTGRSDLHHALSGVPALDSLWWTHRRLNTWSLPYYPYERTEHGYKRLVDGDPLVYM